MSSAPTSNEGAIAALQSELADKTAILQVFESRYNQEHQRGLSLELATKRLEARVMALESENAVLREANEARASASKAPATPKPTTKE